MRSKDVLTRRNRPLQAVVMALLVTVCLPALLSAAPVPVERRGDASVVRFDPDDVALVATEQGMRVKITSYPAAAERPGAPRLPLVPVVIEIPVDRTAVAVSAEFDEVTIARGVELGAAPSPRRADGAVADAPSSPELFRGATRYPARLARIMSEGFARGHRLVTVELAPLSWTPDTGELRLATTIRLRFDFDVATDRPLERHRRLPRAEARYERALAAATGVRAPAVPHAQGTPEPEPFVPSFPPSTDGSAVEYVIITNDDMKLEFQLLANWRTQTGKLAVVRTIEWIEGYYPNGADRAEQVRFFLQDAYQHWGTLWVLLAGDTEIIPVRYATSLVQTSPDDPHYVPTDLYYACLDGNWNADKDDRIGEGWISMADPGDDSDMYPDLFVGRVPMSTSQEATDYVQKLMNYERLLPIDDNYPGSLLFIAEDLGFMDGASIAQGAFDQVHPWMKAVRLYENFGDWPGSEPLTKEAVLDSIDTGFGWVHHVGHGYRNTMSVADGAIGNPDADNLTNGDRQSFVFAINCSSASIDFNSIGERWLKNPDGGSVAYIGTTRLAYAAVSERYQNEFYRLAFADSIGTVGECFFMSRLPWVGAAGAENYDRWTQLTLILLGDPSLPLWTNTTSQLYAEHDSYVILGTGSFTVTALNEVSDPVPDARVTLWAIAEDYKTGLTDQNGQVTLLFDPETPGTFQTTVLRRNFLAREGAVPVVPSTVDPYIFVQWVSVNDVSGPSQGNGDSLANSGETVELIVALRNSGTVMATGISAGLVAETGTEQVEVMSGTVGYDDLGHDQVAQGVHLVHILPSAPHGFLPRFRMDVTTNEGPWSDIFVLPVYTIEMEQYGHEWLDPLPGGNGNGVIEAGETIQYTVELRNNGVGEAVDVQGTLRVLSATTFEPEPLVTVTDSTGFFGDMSPSSRESAEYGFVLDAAADPSQLLLELTIEDTWAICEVHRTDLVLPGAVDSLRASGSDVSITVKWGAAGDDDLLGYDVFRAAELVGPYQRINGQTVVGITFYEDHPLPALTRYYYKIAARDSSFNQGDLSAVIASTTNPPLHTGWPIELGQSTTSGIKLFDIDAQGPPEMIVGADYVYAWHADGTEVHDGDGDPRTSGVFSIEGYDEENGFRGDPAIADLDGDYEAEIILTGWGHSAGVGQLHVLGLDGTPRPGWPRTLLDTRNWSSPVIGQLTADASYEIVTVQGQNGIVFAFHADGTEVYDGDADPSTIGPYFLTGGEYHYGSPALGDLDGDGLDEIIVAENESTGRIFALDPQGSQAPVSLPGWPFATGGSITASAVIIDIDESGLPEVIITSESDSVYVLRADGTRFPGWPQPAEINSTYARTPSPVVVDLDQNGVLDILVLANDGQFHVWDRDGNVLPGWENVLLAQTALDDDISEATPTVGDIDGDGEFEILVGAEDGRLYGLNHDGTEVRGFPIQLEGEVRASATIWDIDQDGLVEIAMACWDQNVRVWDMPYVFDESLTPWPYFRLDLMNRGNPEPPPQIGITAGNSPTLPRVFRLGPAWPNPFNPSTQFDLDVPAGNGPAAIRLSIYDVAGRSRRTLVNAPLPPGRHRMIWDGRDQVGRAVASGVYFIHAAAPGFDASRKILLLK